MAMMVSLPAGQAHIQKAEPRMVEVDARLAESCVLLAGVQGRPATRAPPKLAYSYSQFIYWQYLPRPQARGAARVVLYPIACDMVDFRPR